MLDFNDSHSLTELPRKYSNWGALIVSIQFTVVGYVFFQVVNSLYDTRFSPYLPYKGATFFLLPSLLAVGVNIAAYFAKARSPWTYLGVFVASVILNCFYFLVLAGRSTAII